MQALIVAQDSDSNSDVRRAAAKSLRAPVHQEYLEQSDPAERSFLASMFHDPRWKWAPVYAVFLFVSTALVFAVDSLWILLPAAAVGIVFPTRVGVDRDLIPLIPSVVRFPPADRLRRQLTPQQCNSAIVAPVPSLLRAILSPSSRGSPIRGWCSAPKVNITGKQHAQNPGTAAQWHSRHASVGRGQYLVA